MLAKKVLKFQEHNTVTQSNCHDRRTGSKLSKRARGHEPGEFRLQQRVSNSMFFVVHRDNCLPWGMVDRRGV